jgi:hypothetical protein
MRALHTCFKITGKDLVVGQGRTQQSIVDALEAAGSTYTSLMIDRNCESEDDLSVCSASSNLNESESDSLISSTRSSEHQTKLDSEVSGNVLLPAIEPASNTRLSNESLEFLLSLTKLPQNLKNNGNINWWYVLNQYNEKASNEGWEIRTKDNLRNAWKSSNLRQKPVTKRRKLIQKSDGFQTGTTSLSERPTAASMSGDDIYCVDNNACVSNKREMLIAADMNNDNGHGNDKDEKNCTVEEISVTLRGSELSSLVQIRPTVTGPVTIEQQDWIREYCLTLQKKGNGRINYEAVANAYSKRFQHQRHANQLRFTWGNIKKKLGIK